jgi:hypothetical protein
MQDELTWPWAFLLATTILGSMILIAFVIWIREGNNR